MTVIIDRELRGGTQVVHRFENNFWRKCCTS